MPLFEYDCRQCGTRFETLVRAQSRPSCPSCKSEELDRVLSVFAVSTRSSTASSPTPTGACSTCGDPRGPGSCSMN